MWNVVIIGGGISGLTAAHQLVETRRGLRVAVIEASPSLGGKIVTERGAGFVVEGGPDAFIAQKPWALELVRELGLEGRLIRSRPEVARTFVVRDRRLIAMPEGFSSLIPRSLGGLARSPLLSWGAKLRLLGERWVPPRAPAGDESVGDFVRRRLGNEALERLAEPLLAHIHVADIDRMSLAATYPRLRDLETRFGSLTAGLRARDSTGRPRGPVFFTLKGGMGEIIERLAERVPRASLHLDCRVLGLERAPGGSWRLHLDRAEPLETESVILAVPAFAAAELLAPVDPGLGRRLDELRDVSLATLSLGYRRGDFEHPLDGYGFFVPRGEVSTILACTWTSSKYTHRAPQGDVLLRVFLGGALAEATLAESDSTIVRRVRQELGELLGIRATPILERLYRWPRGYPQYDVGHRERVAAIEAAVPPGIVLAGCAYHGVGLPDCIKSGRDAAEQVLAVVDTSPSVAELITHG